MLIQKRQGSDVYFDNQREIRQVRVRSGLMKETGKKYYG